MARKKSIGIRSNLKGLVSDQQLLRVARETGFVKRLRKIHPGKFLWTLLLGFGTGGQRQIAGMRRAYVRGEHRRHAGALVVLRSFHPRVDEVPVVTAGRPFAGPPAVTSRRSRGRSPPTALRPSATSRRAPRAESCFCHPSTRGPTAGPPGRAATAPPRPDRTPRSSPPPELPPSCRGSRRCPCPRCRRPCRGRPRCAGRAAPA